MVFSLTEELLVMHVEIKWQSCGSFRLLVKDVEIKLLGKVTSAVCLLTWEFPGKMLHKL